MKDQDDNSAVDDNNISVTFGLVNGFTVFCTLTVSGAASGSVTVNEGAASQSVTIPAMNVLTPALNTYHDGASTAQKKSEETAIELQVGYKTVPSHAEPRKNIKCSVAFAPKYYWAYELQDSDWYDAGGDSISITWTSPPTPFGQLSVGYTFVLGDDDASSVAGVWEYATDDNIGAARRPSAVDFEYHSSSLYDNGVPGSGDYTATNMNKSANLSRPKNHVSLATYIASQVVAAESEADDWGRIKGYWDSSTFSLSSVSY